LLKAAKQTVIKSNYWNLWCTVYGCSDVTSSANVWCSSIGLLQALLINFTS
jgi:hypothetical protein